MVTVKWKVTTASPSPHWFQPDVTYFLNYSIIERGFTFKAMFQPMLNVVPDAFQPITIGILFFCSCTLTGFLTIAYVLRDKPSIKKSYDYIKNLNNKELTAESVNELTDNLKWAKYGSNLLGGFSRE